MLLCVFKKYTFLVIYYTLQVNKKKSDGDEITFSKIRKILEEIMFKVYDLETQLSVSKN